MLTVPPLISPLCVLSPPFVHVGVDGGVHVCVCVYVKGLKEGGHLAGCLSPAYHWVTALDVIIFNTYLLVLLCSLSVVFVTQRLTCCSGGLATCCALSSSCLAWKEDNRSEFTIWSVSLKDPSFLHTSQKDSHLFHTSPKDLTLNWKLIKITTINKHPFLMLNLSPKD